MDLTKCKVPCPDHTHACDRRPDHLGPHRDRQQKGTETCSWNVVEDVEWMRRRAQRAEAELERLRADLTTARGQIADHRAALKQVTEEDQAELERLRKEAEAEREVGQTFFNAMADQRDELKAAIERVRADCEAMTAEQHPTDTDHKIWLSGVYAQAKRTLNVLAALDTPTPPEGDRRG